MSARRVLIAAAVGLAWGIVSTLVVSAAGGPLWLAVLIAATGGYELGWRVPDWVQR